MPVPSPATPPATAPDPALVDAFVRQGASCAHVGSPLYASLLRSLTDDLVAGGLTAELLAGVSADPLRDAVPLRYLAVVHRLVLEGRAPELARSYPSCGGHWDGRDLGEAFLAVAAEHRAELERGVRRGVQTNEVGRAAALVAGLSRVAGDTGSVLRTLEVGASAGLLSRWPHYHYDTGVTATGDPISPVRFDPGWWAAPPPPLHPQLRVAEVAACDLDPVDVSTPAGRLAMLSFLWPDQLERRARLLAAFDVAAAHPLAVERADAGEWLARRLAGGLPAGTATVVMHAIVWQYLPRGTRDRLREALHHAGRAATPSRSLHWLRMEPATAEHADLRLTSWPPLGEGSDRDDGAGDASATGGTVLAEVGYHGAPVRWRAEAG